VPPPQDLTALYTLVGAGVLAQLAGMIGTFVRWLGNRTVEHEDKEKASLRSDLEKLEERIDEMDKVLAAADHSFVRLEESVKGATAMAGEVQGVLKQLSATLETRFDKQGTWYREEVAKVVEAQEARVKDLEYSLRQSFARAQADALPPVKRR
jgi:chromosome segregation ATPase